MEIIATVEHYINGVEVKPVTIKLSEDDLKEMIEEKVYNMDSNNDIHSSYAKTLVITILNSA